MNPSDNDSMPKRLLFKEAISRRQFLHFMQCMGLGAFIGPIGPMNPLNEHLLKRLPGRVVHIEDADATSWNFSSGWYGNYIDQGVVDLMVERGLIKLTGASSVAEAWRKLIPHYIAGQTLAIKVNFNNFMGSEPDSNINAVIEPVNAVIGTLIQFGFSPNEITVYDVTNGFHAGKMPQINFINRCAYPGVNFVCYYGNPDPFSATEKVSFDCPPPPKPQIADVAICNALANSDYLINMPLIKAHPYGYVTLGFKHHFGSVNRCDTIHTYLPNSSQYVADYSPLVDLMKNPHFGAKTVLTVGDGLFGNWKNVSGSPLRWLTFGNTAPNSLFFSADKVAIDSLMSDLIDFERRQQGFGILNLKARDYLKIAEQEGMGVFEQGDPWQLPRGSGYRLIRYVYVNGV
ncbi:MAG: DUF362 domain-containing protein [Planctomycetota bacterium]